MDHRYHKVTWGPQGTRIRTAKQYWRKPVKWNMTWWVECEVCHLRQVFNEHGRCPKCQHPMVATMRRVRQRVRENLVEVKNAGYSAVRIHGDGDIADICRLTCLEQGIAVVEMPEVPVLEVRDTKVVLHIDDLPVESKAA